MRLIDEPEAERLYGVMGPATIISGGSVANSIVGVASLGGRAAYIGKVKADEVGRRFTHDIRAMGVHFHRPGAGRPSDRPQLHPGHAGWRAHDEHLSRRVPEFGPADVDRATVEASSYAISKAICGTATRRRRPSAAPPPSPTRQGTRLRRRCRTASAWIATATNSSN